MAGSRSLDELQQARRMLFDSFPANAPPEAAFAYQLGLAAEIRKTEAELAVEKTQERKDHLHGVRRYGDALAMSYLSTYATRQLSRNPGSPAHLSAQAGAFDFTLASAERLSQQGLPVLVADLTNIIRVGDVVVCTDPNAPSLLECKSGGGSGHRGRSSRAERQVARMQSVEHFMMQGTGVIFGETAPRTTLTVSASPEFNYTTVGELVREALDHRPAARAIRPHELIAVARVGEIAAGLEEEVRSLDLLPGTQLVSGTSLELVGQAWPDLTPPILWHLPALARWELMEGNVSISHTARVDAFIGMCDAGVEVRSVSRRAAGFPWHYELLVDGEVVTVSGIVLRDVIYTHETVASAGRRMLEMAAQARAVFSRVDVPS